MASRPILRAAIIAGLAFLTGCHAGGVGNLAPKSEPTLPKISLTATDAIEKHNLNSALVQSLEAKPRMTVSGALNSSVEGRMAMERPKNFKLQMFPPMSRTPAADIGSNGDEFWFWTKAGRNSKDNAVLVCSYEDLDRTTLSAAFQPDWIIEAMGLRTISREEADSMMSKPGDVKGTIKLVSTRRGNGNGGLTKETIIDLSGQIREHRLFQGEGTKRKLLAQATVAEYKSYKVTATESVNLPYRFKLEWIQEQLALDITLDSVKVNPKWTEETRQARFIEPEIPGSKRVNLADYAPSPTTPAPSRATADPAPARPRTRSSRTAPPLNPGGNIRLGAPEPFGVEGASRTPNDPVALTADLRDQPNGSVLDQVVRPGIPAPPNE